MPLKTGVFPEILKSALVKPSVKNENGDTNSYENYRSISNLPFLSKVIEKSVHRQLHRQLQNFKVATSLTIVVKLPPWLSTMTFV